MTEEIEKWLIERIERERQVTLELVVGIVQLLLREHVKNDGAALKQRLEQEFSKLEEFVNQMRALTERMAALNNRAAHDESVDRIN